MKTPQDYTQSFFGEIQFATCPTEEKEPFFWRWSEHGKEIIKDFLLSSLEEHGQQEYLRGRNDAVDYIKRNAREIEREFAYAVDWELLDSARLPDVRDKE